VRPMMARGLVLARGALVVCCALIAFTGCGKAVRSVRAPGSDEDLFYSYLYAEPSHQGDRAIIIHPDRDKDAPGMLACIVDFGTRRRTVIPRLRLRTYARWSPDDRFVAITRALQKGKSQAGILEVARLKWHPIRIGSSNSRPAWSPDGRYILLQVVEDLPMPDCFWVYLYTVETGECIPVAVGNILWCHNPFWRNGFVFCRLASGPRNTFTGLPRCRFFFRTLDGKSQREILPHQFIERVSASPSGTAVAALCLPEAAQQTASLREKGYTMYILTDPDMPHPQKVAAGKFVDLSWSMHGDRIVACLRQQAEETHMGMGSLQIIDISKGTASVVVDARGEPVQGWAPRWVGDDRQIMYLCYGSDGGVQIWSYTLGTGTKRKLYPFEHHNSAMLPLTSFWSVSEYAGRNY